MISILLFIFGGLFIVYDFVLIALNPGTFLDNVISFTHIWLALGGYLIFVGIYRKKTGHSFWSCWKKWIKITVSSLVSFGVLISIINLCLILTPKIADLDENADYVILLGGGISKDGKLPSSVMSRVKKTADYLNKHKNAICVVTGGTLKWLPYPEAPEIKRQLEKMGIESERILLEDQAKDTIQNLQFSCQLLANENNISIADVLESKIIIITSRFHLRRAERLANRMGFKNIKGIPTRCPLIYVLHNYVREICAYVKLNLRIILTGKPENILLS